MKIPILKIEKSAWLLLLFIGAFFGANLWSTHFRYVFYILPIIALVVSPYPAKHIRDLIRWRAAQQTRSAKFTVHFVYLTFGLISYSLLLLLFRQDFYERFFQESIFISSAALFIYVFGTLKESNASDDHVKLVFWGVAVTFIAASWKGFLQLFTQFGSFMDMVVFSNMPTEHYSCFLFGLCCLYFTSQKDWKFALFAVVFTLFSFKRIAIIGVVASGTLWWFIPRLTFLFKRKYLVLALIVCLNLLYLGLIYVLLSNRFEEDIILTVGSSTQGITSGRMKTFALILQELGGFDWWGYGLGKTAQVLQSSNHYLDLMHSDILKLLIEIGPFGFSIWITLFYWPFLKQPKSLIFPLYMNFLFFTDNTFIYFEVLVIFYLLSTYTLQKYDATPS
ncbi:MAG: hypothetical protein ACPGJS_04770 [Flammeovirgaceae bacterium]